MKKLPDFSYEKPAWKKGFVVIGIDEVGRGALAGPLTVGAVCFKPEGNNEKTEKIRALGINDSKVLSARKREELSIEIKNYALAYATASASVDDIKMYGLTKATGIICSTVISQIAAVLSPAVRLFVLMDGKYCPPITSELKNNIKTIIDGDAKSISISAASIIAKVERDEKMRKLSAEYPDYRWDLNKGYGTALHRNALFQFGKTEHHRIKFIERIFS